MIRVKNLTFAYENGKVPVLKDINMDINQGEYLALIGPNGCGKTTLIRHFNALLLPSRGEVEVDGLSTRNQGSLLEIRRRVGMIFQNPDNQIVGMSVEEDIAFGPGNLGLPVKEVRARVDQALQTVGLTSFATRAPHTLSGGEKQLLALAGLLAMHPSYIVLDEPTSALDPAAKKRVLHLLQELKFQGIGIIHVTHNMDEAAMADRVMVMDQGELIAGGSPGSVLSRVDWLKSLNLAPPRVTELIWRLRQGGVDLDTGILSVEDAAAEITALLQRSQISNDNSIPGKADTDE